MNYNSSGFDFENKNYFAENLDVSDDDVFASTILWIFYFV